MKLKFLPLLMVATCFSVHEANAQFGFGGQQIQPADMHCSEKFTDLSYTGDTAVFHKLDVYLPDTKADKYPVVVHIYGSAWFSNNSKGMADLGTIVTAYLKAGYAVVCPNHRSSSDAKWPAQCHDIKAVVRWIRGNADKYHFDTDFVATSGFSSGGHLSSVMASTSGNKTAQVGDITVDLEGNLGNFTNLSSSIDCAVDWSGPIDLENMDCAGKRDMPFSPEQALLGVPLTAENHDIYASLSPIAYLDPADVPVIIFHGKKDNVVPFCQGQEWNDKLAASGVHHEFYPVENGGHGFDMYSEENLNKAVAFLNKVRKSKPADIKPIPEAIRKPASKKGTIEVFTYQAKRDGKMMTKKARVYLPNGYNPKDKKKQYNVLYLMHGGGDNSTSFLTPPQNWLPLSQVLDHLIADGKMDPIIVVTPTYYNDDENIGANNMNDAVRYTEEFHNEMREYLIPTVEKAYNTYYKGDAIATRNHRALGGFSLGALAAWHQLAHGINEVSIFVPLSGDMWVYDSNHQKQSAEVAAKYLDDEISKSKYADDFTVYAYTGTKDIAGTPEKNLVMALLSNTKHFSSNNLSFSMKQGGEHYYGHINEYLYYALPLLWKKNVR